VGADKAMSEIKNNLPAEPTIAKLSVAILDDVRTLVQKQFELFSVEIQERVERGSSWLAVALFLSAIAVFAIQLLVVGVILYVAEAQQIPMYQSFGFAGGLLMLVCTTGALLAVWRLRKSGEKLESPQVFKQVLNDLFRVPKNTPQD
jgi:uncharacterized membrane protein YqjE